MNQKWIKYLALSFALVLALGLISAIVNGSLALIKAFGFFNYRIENQEKDDFSQHFEGDLEALIVEVSAGDVLVQTGKELMVQGNQASSDLIAKFENKTLIVESNPNLTNVFDFLNQEASSQITITLPNNLNLKRLEMEIGAGQASLKNISSDELILKQGAGKLLATHVIAKEGVLDGGAGSVSFSDSQLNNFDINAGIGPIDFQGILTGDININAGIGEISLTIEGDFNDYFISSDPGLGAIKANGQSIPENGLGLESSDHHIDINGGLGLVTLSFEGK